MERNVVHMCMSVILEVAVKPIFFHSEEIYVKHKVMQTFILKCTCLFND